MGSFISARPEQAYIEPVEMSKGWACGYKKSEHTKPGELKQDMKSLKLLAERCIKIEGTEAASATADSPNTCHRSVLLPTYEERYARKISLFGQQSQFLKLHQNLRKFAKFAPIRTKTATLFAK